MRVCHSATHPPGARKNIGVQTLFVREKKKRPIDLEEERRATGRWFQTL